MIDEDYSQIAFLLARSLFIDLCISVLGLLAQGPDPTGEASDIQA